jgi:chemotaxis protein histidine kinase CheA
MDKRLTKLRAMGCDVDGAMERFLEDEAFYFECYDKAMQDPCFDLLEEDLENHDVKSAFENAHTLKGVIGNLGLTPLLEMMTQIVEPLRVGEDEGMIEKYQEFIAAREEYTKI